MSKTIFKPWGVQYDLICDTNKVIGAFAGKRGGKTEVGAVKAIQYMINKPGHVHSDIDEYIGVIVAPTSDMLRRLSMKKFLAYAKPYIIGYHETHSVITWYDGSLIYGVSAEKPQRFEGIKASWIWCDEVFQIKEQFFLEAHARILDSKGYLICTGSLGIQYVNPRQHWAHKWFKETPFDSTSCYEWKTEDNPYIDKNDLLKLKNTLDPQTYRSMYEICWDTNSTNAVYGEFSDDNIYTDLIYNSKLETYITIDWGYAHPMAILFIQYDRANDVVYVLDEIVESKIDIMSGKLWDKIISITNKHGIERIDAWVADRAGDQERELVGLSNIMWFKKNKAVDFKFRSSRILEGVALVRSYVRSSFGRRRLFIANRCKKTIDGMKNYKYAEKDGIIQNENPIKKDDDAVDSLRYFFVNIMDMDFFNRKSRSIQL